VESTETPKPISQTVTQNAREDSGEDNGAGIIPAIILGIGGALAAAGILGSSSGKNKNNSEDKKKRAFRMKVYKNFGDSIRRGAKPVTVWARIVEVVDGHERNRPDLSERITASGEGHYRHKKQTGGAGQFAEVMLKIEPNEGGYEFVNAVVGGNIPKNFIPAVEKGVAETMANGPLVGCIVENVKVTLLDGKYHPVDSNEMAFKIASRMAFRDAMSKARPVLLEPVMKIHVQVPDGSVGDINGDINHKRGRILDQGMEDGMPVIHAEVPMAELSRYATELRSMTQGKGSFEVEFDHYEQVPANVANEIIAQHQKEQQEE